MRVMLDRSVAELYGVKTKVLKQAVKRNIGRFPKDFMFELTKLEFDNLRSQIVTSSWGGTRYSPMAFTEQGVAMMRTDSGRKDLKRIIFKYIGKISKHPNAIK